MLFAGCANRIMQPSSRPDARFGSFATKTSWLCLLVDVRFSPEAT